MPFNKCIQITTNIVCWKIFIIKTISYKIHFHILSSYDKSFNNWKITRKTIDGVGVHWFHILKKGNVKWILYEKWSRQFYIHKSVNISWLVTTTKTCSYYFNFSAILKTDLGISHARICEVVCLPVCRAHFKYLTTQ